MKIDRSPAQAAALCALVTCALWSDAHAASALPTTVVTATRTEQAVTDVVADISVLDRADIERLGAVSVPQLLAELPGVQTMGYGDAQRVYIRGADAYMTVLYVDGVRVYSQDGVSTLGGGAPWELIPVSQIERIEVLRGPASAVYGSDAMGGVIQIFTRKGEGAFTPYVNLGAGSYGRVQSDAGFSGSQAGWDYALGVGYKHLDGWDTRPDFVRSPNRESETQQSSSLRLGYQLSVDQRLDYSTLQTMLDSQFPYYDGTSVKEIPAKGNLRSEALKWSAQWSPRYRSGLSLSRSTIAKRDASPNDYATQFDGALWENHFLVAGGTLSAVLEHKKESFNALADANGNPAFQGSRQQQALALGYAVQAGPHTVQLNAREDRDSLFGPYQTGALGYGYALNPLWRLTASVGSAFKAPSLEQLYSQYGSAQLKPETNDSEELGLQYAAPGRSFKAVMYRNQIKNMISSSASVTSCSYGSYCYYNVGQASIRGFTLSGTQHWQGFDVHASWDRLEPRNDGTGRVLSLRAREMGTLGLDTSVSGWRLGLEVQHVGARYNEADNTHLLPAYDLLNLSASKTLGADWRVLLRVDNATDQVYVQALGYDTSYNTTPIVAPRATYFVGVQWQPRR